VSDPISAGKDIVAKLRSMTDFQHDLNTIDIINQFSFLSILTEIAHELCLIERCVHRLYGVNQCFALHPALDMIV